MIGIIGTIQTRNYENQQGQRVYVTEVIASNFQLLESRNSQQNNQGYQDNHGGYQQQQNYSNQGSNFQNGNNQGGYQSPFDTTPQQGSFFQGQTTNPMDIDDSDLPF